MGLGCDILLSPLKILYFFTINFIFFVSVQLYILYTWNESLLIILYLYWDDLIIFIESMFKKMQITVLAWWSVVNLGLNFEVNKKRITNHQNFLTIYRKIWCKACVKVLTLKYENQVRVLFHKRFRILCTWLKKIVKIFWNFYPVKF